MAEFKPRSWN